MRIGSRYRFLLAVLIAAGWSALVVIAQDGKGRVEKEELEFSGSFWDDGDSFRLRVDFSKSPAELHWDGYADLWTAFDQGDKGDGKPPRGRVKFSTRLSAEEDGSFRRVWERMHLCDPGPQMAIGTGLSTKVWIRSNGAEKRLFFFAPPRENFLAQVGESVALTFQQAVTGDGIEAKGRESFFEFLGNLEKQLGNYQQALDLLEEAFKNDKAPDWGTIWDAVRLREKPFDPDGENEYSSPEETPPEVVRSAVPGILSAYAKENFPDSRVAIHVESTGSAATMEWGQLPHRAALDLTGEKGAWAIVPAELKFLIEDFVSQPSPRSSPYFPSENHPVFYLDDLSDEQARRLRFVTSAPLYSHLFRGEVSREQAAQVNWKAIYALGVDKQGTTALIHTVESNEALIDEYRKSDDGEWMFVQTKGYEEFWRARKDRAKVLELNGGRDPFAAGDGDDGVPPDAQVEESKQPKN